jgi:hypothetical protein
VSPRLFRRRTYMIATSGRSALTFNAAASASSASTTIRSVFPCILSPTVNCQDILSLPCDEPCGSTWPSPLSLAPLGPSSLGSFARGATAPEFWRDSLRRCGSLCSSHERRLLQPRPNDNLTKTAIAFQGGRTLAPKELPLSAPAPAIARGFLLRAKARYLALA